MKCHQVYSSNHDPSVEVPGGIGDEHWHDLPRADPILSADNEMCYLSILVGCLNLNSMASLLPFG